MVKTSTQSTTRAKLLTGLTVAAAGVAAYAVASLSSDPSAINGLSPASLDAMHQSCVASCVENGGYPCAVLVDPAKAADCRAQVQACINSCPAASGTGIVSLDSGSAVQALPAGRVGGEYRARLVIAGFEQEQGEWTVGERALPPGLSVDAQGTLFGTPTEARDYQFKLNFRIPEVRGVRAEINAGVNLTMNVQPAAAATTAVATAATPVRITTPLTNITLTLGEPYQLRMAADGLRTGDAPVWFVSYGTLPTGLSMNADGFISGTPTRKDTYAVGISVRTQASGLNAVASQDGRFLVVDARETVSLGSTAASTNVASAILPLSATLSDGRVGTYASFPFSVSGDATDRTWVVEGIGESDGMSFDQNTHVLSGTPRAAKTYQITVRSAKGSNVLVKNYAWNVVGDRAPLSAISTMPTGVDGQPYRAQLRATGGSGQYRWSFERPNVIPREWSLSADGELVSTNPKEGVFTFSVILSDAVANETKVYPVVVNIQASGAANVGVIANTGTGNANTADANTNTVTANQPDPIVIDTFMPDGVAGQPYDVALKVRGGSNAYSWGFAPNVPAPSGWVIEAGHLKMLQTVAGVYPVHVRASNMLGDQHQDALLTIRIVSPGTVANTNANTNSGANTNTNTAPATTLAYQDVGAYPDGFVGFYYSSRPFRVTGGTAPYRFTQTGTLPNGLSMDPEGNISGTPTRAETTNFTVTVRDAANDSVVASRSIRIREAAERIVNNTVSVAVPANTGDPILQARLDSLRRIGLRIHDLVKLQDDGDANTQYDSTVYYIGSDGRRHAFPNPRVYFSWFQDFANVRIVGAHDLSDVPLGANITYRPGTRLVKFLSDPRVYVVDANRRLRLVRSEADARTIYGTNWGMNVDDISDAFYMDYRIEGAIDAPTTVNPSVLTASTAWPSDVLPQ